MIASAQATDDEYVDTRGDGYFWLLTLVLVGAILYAFLAPAQPGSPLATLAVAVGRHVEATHAVSATTLGWLGALSTAFVYDFGGWRAVGLVSGLTVIAALILTEVRSRRRSDELLGMTMTLLASLTMLDALHPGAGAATWLLCAAFLYALDRPGSGVYWTIPLAVVWCNLSPSGILAPALALLYAVGRTLGDGSASSVARRAWILFAGCALALLATPAGLGYAALAANALHLQDGPLQTAPAVVAPVAYRAGGYAILLLVTLLGLRGQRLHDSLFFFGAALLALHDGRYLPLFGIVAAPLAAEAAARAKLFPQNLVRVAALALCAALAAGATWNVYAPPASAFSPAELTAALDASGDAPRVYCGRLEWCDYVAAAQGRASAYMDERVEIFPPSVVATQVAIARLKPKWRGRLAAAGIDTVLVDRRSALDALLSRSAGWSRAGSAGDLRIFKRDRADK